MYRHLRKHGDAILAHIEANADRLIAPYTRIVREQQDPTCCRRERYQREFRHYWAMNVARLSDSFYERYFSILEDGLGGTGPALIGPDAVARELYDAAGDYERRKLQFSFATKLVHMVDRRKPVYDSYVVKFYFLDEIAAGAEFEAKLAQRMTFYKFLEREHRRVLEGGLFADLVQQFRTRHAYSSDVFTDEKIVDTLIWQFAAWVRNAVIDGRVAYSV